MWAVFPANENHKGQNGKLLLVGGSNLFHSASLWSAKMAAHVVDMVFYASVQQNNRIIEKNKKNFVDGIVIAREQILDYAEEAEVILLGPGMERGERRRERLEKILASDEAPTAKEWESETYLITNYLLAKLPEKKFVLDAGALQMLDLDFLPANCILTPHKLEWENLQKMADSEEKKNKLERTVILKKGLQDEVWYQGQLVATIKGGNAGLTKGGSGDVLAGLAAAIYTMNTAVVAASVASKAIKMTADKLYTKVGPFFTTTQLMENVPANLWEIVRDF